MAGSLLDVAVGETATTTASSELRFAPRVCNSLVSNSTWQHSVWARAGRAGKLTSLLVTPVSLAWTELLVAINFI